jgi:hypothetical protein
MLDGDIVTDVDIMPNTMKHVISRSIFTCATGVDAMAFVKGLKRLVHKHTLTEIDVEKL